MAEDVTHGNVTVTRGIDWAGAIPAPRLAQPLGVWWMRRNGSDADADAVVNRHVHTPASASGTMTWCDVGAWHTRFPLYDSQDIPTEDAIFMFTAGGTVFTSGPMEDYEISPDATGKLMCEVWGVTEEVILQDRVIYPDPQRWPEIQTTQSHDRRSGTASTVMMGYALDHTRMGDPVLGTWSRAYGNLQMGPDPVAGSTISMRERWSGLLDTLQRAALKGGVGFRITREMSGHPTFEVYQPKDRSMWAVFSVGRGTVSDLTWRKSAPTATQVIAAGTGELTARIIAQDAKADEFRYHRHIELFRDQRSESDKTQMHADNKAELAKNGARETIRVEATPALTYGEHYALGDKVRVVVDGQRWDGRPIVLREIVDRVQQVQWEATPSGVVFSPVVGEDGSVSLVNGQRETSRRLQQIEGAA
ncbi:Gp37-like protein [Cumulibacter soli]|uniref:Gp37-like protein n=1 Tax=Cumulibacter soli TaxID=2546344 RepID=UPI001067F3D3|nr:hypothetical protein [Cumulibacter soli]